MINSTLLNLFMRGFSSFQMQLKEKESPSALPKLYIKKSPNVQTKTIGLSLLTIQSTEQISLVLQTHWVYLTLKFSLCFVWTLTVPSREQEVFVSILSKPLGPQGDVSSASSSSSASAQKPQHGDCDHLWMKIQVLIQRFLDFIPI